MRKWLLICLFVCRPVVSISQGNNGAGFPLSRLTDTSHYVMIIAHRGDWRNAPENSLQAFKNCIDAGIDGIEIDVQETKDGEIVIMHDATVNRTTNGRGRVRDLTLAEIKALRLKTGINTLTRQQVPTLEEVLQLCKGKVLLHIDKWEPVKDKVLAIARKLDCLDQLIFRSTRPAARMKELFGDDISKVNYIPVVTAGTDKSNDQLNDYLENTNAAVIGIAFSNDKDPMLDRVPEIKKKGIRVWFNALVGKKFNDGHDDELAVTDLENSYGWLLKKGADAIMTDRHFLLLDYLKKNNRR
jgi:glycerophosphoryl diester phosphodiesterase